MAMLQQFGYDPNLSLVGQRSLESHSPQLQALANAMGGDKSQVIDKFPELMSSWFWQNARGTGGQSVGGGPYDLSDAGISAKVDPLVQGGAASPEWQQYWLRSLDNGGPLAKIQALEDLARGGMLPGYRQASANLRENQYNDYWNRLNTDKNFNDKMTYIDLVQGRANPWQPTPLPGGEGGGTGGGGATPPGSTPPVPPASTPPGGATPPGSTPPVPPGTTPDAAAQAFMAVLKAAGVNKLKDPGKNRGQYGTWHPDTGGNMNFSLGSYDYSNLLDTNRMYKDMSATKGKLTHRASALNMALYRWQLLKKQNPALSDVDAWDQAVEFVTKHSNKDTGVFKRKAA
jgi:hypothetical protein